MAVSDDSEGEVRKAGKAMRAAGVNGVSRSQELSAQEQQEIAENRKIISENVVNGKLMILERSHIRNYDALIKHPDKSGRVYSEVNVVLSVDDDKNKVGFAVNRVGNDEAVVAVNNSAIVPTEKFRQDYIKHQLKFGNAKEVKPEDVWEYSKLSEDAADMGFTKPPRIILSGMKNSEVGFSQIIALPDGVPVVMIGNKNYGLIEDVLREYQPQSKEGLASLRTEEGGGRFVELTDKTDARLLEYIRDSAVKAGVPNISVFIDNADDTNNMAIIRMKGGAALLLGKKYASPLIMQQESAVDHEFAHMKSGHFSLEGLLEKYAATINKQYNILAGRESMADKVSVCDTENIPESARNLAGYFSQEKRSGGVTHPPYNERMSYLREIEKNPEICREILSNLSSPKTPQAKGGDKSIIPDL